LNVSHLEKAEEIAERLRHEPYILFKGDCLTKSLRFKFDELEWG